MGRSHVAPIKQPDDISCGPSALKTALHVLGAKKSLETLYELCKTNRNGTTTKNLITAINTLGYPVLAVEYTTLTHLQNALHYHQGSVRAVMVSYLYDLDKKNRPHPDSGHWATVSSYMANKSRVVLFDSATGQRKSYAWQDFRERWMDYDLKRKKISETSRHFKLIKHWQPQLMLVIAKTVEELPKFKISTSKLFLPKE